MEGTDVGDGEGDGVGFEVTGGNSDEAWDDIGVDGAGEVPLLTDAGDDLEKK